VRESDGGCGRAARQAACEQEISKAAELLADARAGKIAQTARLLSIVENDERRLRAWDFFHAPPWTEHAFVGAGETPCVILMVGSRFGPGVRYPVSEIAAGYGASVAAETSDWREAYATAEWFRRERPPTWARPARPK